MIALLVVVLTPLSMFVASFIARKTHHYFTEQARVRGQQTALINELIEGQKVVQSFGHEAASLSDFDCINDELGRVSLNATFFSSLTNPSTRLVNNIIYAAVALVGALSAVGGGISVGDLSVFLSYASQYAKPFNEISGVVTELQNALACAARVSPCWMRMTACRTRKTPPCSPPRARLTSKTSASAMCPIAR